MKNRHLQGFTLVELSITLVIIGALIGSVLYGQSLLDASKLQTVMTDVDSYITAASNFRQTYQALPGDFSAATTVWGTDSVGCPAGGGTSGTCNGNGDGTIYNTNSAGQAQETFLFWQHLRLAGMFTQNLSNQSGSGGVNDAVIGKNVPAGSIKGTGFSVTWFGSIASGNGSYFTPTNPTYYGNIISLGGMHQSISGTIQYTITQAPILTPTQASQIDTKMDDGLPAYGKVLAYKKNSSIAHDCTTSDTESASTYNVSSSMPYCTLIFLTGF
ncbi:MAG TPA: prepilin-type N-terminal cleavage/methylation domain-containing protein [Rickettsiales bacterium]|nr:prepilin-type N-terminal cleavage/methylation domain-containing protein [Rickettsiales bacterium]